MTFFFFSFYYSVLEINEYNDFNKWDIKPLFIIIIGR